MSNLICKIFGHRPAFGYGNSEGNGYFIVQSYVMDGIGRVHAHLYCDCKRCGNNYHVGNVHIPPELSQKKGFFKKLKG